jgi:electron transfer flavoprotein alpha subunit
VDLAVLLKAVPLREQLRFDPRLKVVRREEERLVPNPYDARAVRVALALRRPGERITVLSMGPPSAEPALREALAQGVDQVVRLGDAALVGSDALVTARVLARALPRAGHGLVLAGQASTDAETGVIPPAVAALLGVPFVGPARSIDRAPGEDRFEVQVEREAGTARYRLGAPALISVGEKITKPGHPSAEELARAGALPVPVWTLAELGLLPGEVGLAGSPTRVGELRSEAPHRSPLILGEAPVEEVVRVALAELHRRLASPAPTPPLPLPLPPSPASDRDEAIVLASDEEGQLVEEALPTLAELARRAFVPTALLVGPRPDRKEARRLAAAGANRIYCFDRPAGAEDPRSVALLADHLLARRPEAVALVALSTFFGREVAAAVAARRGIGLIADATGLGRSADGALWAAKPAFAHALVATIHSSSRSTVLTVRPGAFAPGALVDPPEPLTLELEGPPLPPPVERLERREERHPEWGDLDRARCVIVVGQGIGGPEGIAALGPILPCWDAALGATRKVVDLGWMPVDRQVGLTGRSLAPDLALLLGVAGAPNHLSGLVRARVVVAVNPDPAAPVFRAVDLGLVGRWEDLVPALSVAWATSPRRP